MTYAAKGTVQLNSSHRFDVSFFGDPSTGLNGPQRGTALLNQTTAAFSALNYGGHNQTVRYDGAPSGNWLIEAYFAHAVNSIAEIPSVDTWNVIDRTVTPNVTTGGIGFYEPGNTSTSQQWAVKSTNAVGPHQIKYGFEYDHADWTQLTNYTGPTITAPNGQQTATGATVEIIPDPNLGQIYRVDRARFTAGPVTTQNYETFFVQDTWKVGNRLTVDPGLRYEQETLNGNVITGFDLKNNWALRIGATFDATGDGKTKVYGNWGRFYARMPNDLAARALSSEVTVTRGDYFDANLTQPIPDGTLAGGQTTHLVMTGAVAGDTIDPNTKMSHMNELVAGFEREIMPNTSVGVRYIRRDLGRRAAVGFPGDIRFLGDPNGILPLDRPQQFKLVGNYLFHDLNLGFGFNASSGAPLTPLATNPVYGNGGEIPADARGAGIQTVDGFMTRTPFQTDVDFQAAYQLKMGGARKLTVLADIFNLFDQQIVTGYDTYTSLTFGAGPNPNFGQPTSQIVFGPQIQAPRQIRIGARLSF